MAKNGGLKDLALLGLQVKDRVTGFVGIVSSVGFDLYGCVQAVVTPVAAKEGKMEDSRWFDTKRLEVLNAKPVMEVPDFKVVAGDQAAGGQAKSIPQGL